MQECHVEPVFSVLTLMVNSEFMQEDAGRLQFVCHYNDGEDQHMIWCVSES